MAGWQYRQFSVSVILARLIYASSMAGLCWSPRQTKLFLRRRARVGFYSSDLASFDDLCIPANKNLFNNVLHNPCSALPPAARGSYLIITTLDHAHTTTKRLTHLTDCNFIIRMLFYQVYWQYLMPACFIVLQLRSDSCQIHGYVMCYASTISCPTT